MPNPPDVRQRWWFAAARWARGERPRLKALLELAPHLSVQLLWPPIKSELAALSHRVDASEHGRLALAVLLDTTHHLAPASYPALLDALTQSPPDIPTSGRLWQALQPALEVALRLGPDEDPRPAKDPDALVAYAKHTTDLALHASGTLAAATWAADPSLRPRLVKAGLEPKRMFFDVLALACLIALRTRRILARHGHGWLSPDIAIVHAPASMMFAAVSPTAPPTPTTTPEPAPPDSLAAYITRWAGNDERVRALFAAATRMEKSRLWPLVDEAVDRLKPGAKLRIQQMARMALVVFLEEVRIAFPEHLDEVLDIVAVEGHEQLKHTDLGRLWMLLEPLFGGWARRFDPELASDGTLVVRALHNHGDILPWDDSKPNKRLKHLKPGEQVIDQAYGHDASDPAIVRAATYWAAVRARNDRAHSGPSSLLGVVTPMQLYPDLVAFVALAALRFRIHLASVERADPTVPDMRGLAD